MPLLFRSDDSDAGLEPWVTDGTTLGTGLLRDTSFGGTRDAGGFDFAFTLENGVVFRVSNDDYDGLWFTNGQTVETSLLVDEYGTRLYRQGAIDFDGDFILQGFELLPGRVQTQEFVVRISEDGTQTVLFNLESNADSLIHLGSRFLFQDSTTLFGSNGTAAGTVPLPDFLSEANAGFGRFLQVRTEATNGQNVLVEARSDEDIINLNGADRLQGNSLWISDGTASGTVRLDAIGSISGIETDIVTAGDSAFVRVEATELIVSSNPNVIVTEREDQLWQVNLATESTSLIASLDSLYTGDPALPNPQTFGTGMSEPILNGNEIGFVAYATDRITDGNVSRAVPFADFYQVPFGTQATAADAVRLEHIPENGEFFIFNDQLVYTVRDGATRKYYAADVDTGASTLILETSSVRSLYPVLEPFFLGDVVVFATAQFVFSREVVELYSWDGTSDSAELIGEFTGPSRGSSLAEPSAAAGIRQDGDLLYFVDPSNGLFVSDGTSAGTQVLVQDPNAVILGIVPFADPADADLGATFGDDSIVGDNADNLLFGLAGNDSISGLEGNDTLIGDEDADSIEGGAGSDDLRGGLGNDTLYGDQNDDFLSGGLGDDSIVGGSGFDTLNGGAGDDYLNGGTGADSLNGGDDDDTLEGEEGADRLMGDAGDDLLIGGDDRDVLEGGDNNDTLLGGSDADRLFGGDGDDSIDAGSNLGFARDLVEGGEGNDTIDGGVGFDLLRGGIGHDSILGGARADNLFGDEGNDTLIGGDGNDRLFGGADDDLLQDFEGTGVFLGGAGNDTMEGGDAGMRFFGQTGNDVINAGGGDDLIQGNQGFDQINGGAGNDTMLGGFNADTFIFEDGHGQDVIGDFAALIAPERIDLSAVTGMSLAALDLASATNGAATQVGANVVIDTGGGNSITLNNVNIADLDSTDFIF